jgi:hypothetical protein
LVDLLACRGTNDATCQGEVRAVHTLTVVNGRVGIAYRLLQSHFRLGLDAGAWYGRHVEDSWTAAPDREDTILWPMAGFSALYEF